MTESFKAIRRMVARGGRFRNIAIGEFVRDLIESSYIPKLEKEIAKHAGDQGVQSDIYDRIDLWREYSKGSKSSTWNGIAFNQVMAAAKRTGMEFEDVEEILQDLHLHFYSKMKSADFTKYVDPLDLDKDPDDLKRLFGTIVFRRAMSFMRKHIRDKKKMQRISPEFEQRVFEKAPAQTEMTQLDRKTLRNLFVDLSRYIKSRSNTQLTNDVFEAWIRAAEAKGADNVKLRRDVYPVIEKAYEGIPYITVNKSWKRLRGWIVDFFEDELGIRITDRLKKQLKIGSREYGLRRHIASWVLSADPERMVARELLAVAKLVAEADVA